jgi:hypothetical protein
MKVLPLELLDTRHDAALRRAGYRTFDGWLRRGMVVDKGQRAHARLASGKAVFAPNQVSYLVGSYDVGDEPWLDEDDFLNG